MSHHFQLTLSEAMSNNLSESVDMTEYHMRDLLSPKFEVGQTLESKVWTICEAA